METFLSLSGMTYMPYLMRDLTTNVAVEWLTFLLHIHEVPPLKLDLEIDYLD
jgi:hypothetical protein